MSKKVTISWVNYHDANIANDFTTLLCCEIKIEALNETSDFTEIAKNPIILYHITSNQAHVLDKITELRFRYPQIPLIVTSNEYYENVPIWALRSRIWNYLILPDESEDLATNICRLHATLKENRSQRSPIYPVTEVFHRYITKLSVRSLCNYILERFLNISKISPG